MARTKKVPKTVIQYESLSSELKNLYDKIYKSFEQKIINDLRDEAKKLQVESPTTLGKEELMKRMTDKIIAEYLPKETLRVGSEHELYKNAELRVQGLLEQVDGIYRIGSVLVPGGLVSDFHLRVGDFVEGGLSEVSGNKTLLNVNLIENDLPSKNRAFFEDLVIVSRRSFNSVIEGTKAANYIPDLRMGERIVYENMTQQIAYDLISSFPSAIGLFMGVEPESPVCLESAFFVSPFDNSQKQMSRIAKLALERAKRLCERNNNVVFVIYGFEFLEDADLKRAIFGSGRCFDESSLTVIADVSKDNANFLKVATRIIK